MIKVGNINDKGHNADLHIYKSKEVQRKSTFMLIRSYMQGGALWPFIAG